MEPRVLEKRPAESRLFDWDFSDFSEIKAGQAITGADPFVIEPTGVGHLTATPSTPTFSGARAQTRLTLGVAGTKYIIRCKVTTTDGSKLQREGLVYVLEPAR